MRKLIPLLLVLTVFVTPAVARPQDPNEREEYRKTYVSGIRATPVKGDE